MSVAPPAEEQRLRVVWKPLPGSQTVALTSPCNVVVYEGTRGPGKTDCQLMAFRQLVGRGYGKFWRGIIFDREYKNLDDLVAKSERWFPEFRDGARFLRSKSDYKWVWPTGEELLFRTYSKPNDYWNYHGQEFPFIGWNELTKFATPDPIDLMGSCNRSGFIPEEHTPRTKEGRYITGDGAPLPNIPLRTFMTTNPYGPGHMWVKMRYIDAAEPGEVVTRTTDVYNPRTAKRELVTTSTVRIFGSYRENRYLDPIYVAFLENLEDLNKRKAWLGGCWDIVAGGALSDLWKAEVHIVPDIKGGIPANWKIDRALDWGSSKPFSVGWYAEANGEEVELVTGDKWCPQRGSLIRFAEWYGSEKIGSNTGLYMGSDEVAQKIVEKEMDMLRTGLIKKIPKPGVADGAIYSGGDKATKTTATLMAEQGIEWRAANKSSGTRKTGLELVRGTLRAATKGEGQGLYFYRRCQAAIGLLPMLPRDEDDLDDVDTLAEDHLYDELRYRVLDQAARYPGMMKVDYPKSS